jgi:hypothetical protein
MKQLRVSLLCISAALLSAPLHALEVWHSNTVWAGQGQCAAVFSFDSDLQDVSELRLSVSGLNPAGETILSGELEIHQFGQSSADRYAEAYLEGEALCSSDLVIQVEQATALLNGKPTDLLATQALRVLDFKPLKIQL